MATINFNFKHQDVLVEDYTRAQVQQLIKYRPYRSAIISMMPDCHPGKVTPVGFTAIVNKNNGIMPMALGGDIGCGIVTVNIGDRLKKFDPRSLDVFIRKNIPSGYNIHNDFLDISEKHVSDVQELLENLNYRFGENQYNKYIESIGTLGGGNHFIELGRSKGTGNFYLTVHTGSRSLGQDLTNYYLDIAQEYIKGYEYYENEDSIPRELSFLIDIDMERYIHDIKIVNEYAYINRMEIVFKILKFLKADIVREYHTVHNMIYEWIEDKYLITKGATYSNSKTYSEISFPMNMKDGVAILGMNSSLKWNGCIPHGCGRKYSRADVKNHTTVSEFKKSMKDIYCSNISKDTLDESPAAYKDSDLVLETMHDTLHVSDLDIAFPIYNFKAGGNSNG